MHYNTNSDECGESQSTTPGIQSPESPESPEGHDRNYHLKKADGSPDHHIPLIKSLLARSDVTLHETLVYGLLLDKLGPGRIYCCPTHGEIADTLKIGVRSVERAMASLKAKGLVTTVFVRYKNKYFLPDRHVALAKLDGPAPPHRRSSGEQQVRHTGGAQGQGPPERRSSRARSATQADITNKEYSGEQKDDGNEEGAGSAGRTPADPALPFSGNAAADIGQVSESSIETPSQSDSPISVNSAAAASGQRRNEAATGSEPGAPVASPILPSATKAHAIFHDEYLNTQGTAYVGNRGRDLKLLKNILASGTVTVDQFKYAIRGMLSDDYALGRGAGVNILAKDWGEWQVKGKYIVEYPPGRQVVVPRLQNLVSRQASPSDSIFNKDIPAEHLKADWEHLQEDVRDTVLNAISSPGARSVLLHGQPGTGKSTTAAAVVLGLRDHAECDDRDSFHIRNIARFVSQAEFTRHALNTNFLSKDEGNFGAASWNGATEGSKYVNALMQFNGILVLDDVVHQKSPTKLAPLVIEILNHRHNNNLTTIVTSNLSPAQIAQKLDPAVASRLCGGTVLNFVGEDLRRHPQMEEVRNSA